MPCTVESFCNVKKDSRAHAFVFKSFSSETQKHKRIVLRGVCYAASDVSMCNM
jgi:hypothetical protein